MKLEMHRQPAVFRRTYRRTPPTGEPGLAWWVGKDPACFYAEAHKRDQQRQQEHARVVYPSVADRADVA